MLTGQDKNTPPPGSRHLFSRLSALEQEVLTACAMYAMPAAPTVLHRFLQQADIPERRAPTAQKVALACKTLRKQRLLTKTNQCRADQLESVLRAFVHTGYFQPLTQALARSNPEPESAGDDQTRYQYCLRDIRIAVYRHDVDLFHQALLRYFKYAGHKRFPDPLVTICDNPFDPEWFRGLPCQIQLYALHAIFKNNLLQLKPTYHYLAYLKEKKNLARIPEEYRPSFSYLMISQLLLQADLHGADNFIKEAGETLSSFGLRGWRSFLAGDSVTALRFFEDDLIRLRALNKSGDAFFTGIEGLFYLLALLHDNAFGNFPTVRKIITALESVQPHNIYLPAYRILLLSTNLLENRDQELRALLASLSHTSQESITALFQTTAHFWLDGSIPARLLRDVKKKLFQARQNGHHWLALEYGRLIHAVDKQVSGDLPGTVAGKRRGFPALLDIIRREEPWQRALRALGTASPQTPSQRQHQARLAWRLDYYAAGREIEIRPVVQHRNTKGQWTRGRPIALKKLHTRQRPFFLTDQDHQICQALDHRRERGVDKYRFNPALALPAMVGHPLLFLAEAPELAVSLTRGEPELRMDERDGYLFVRFSPGINAREIVVIADGPARFKIITVSEDHRRVAGIIGKKGLRLPISAKDELIRSLGDITSFMTVHSAEVESPANGLEQAADCRIRAQLMPHGPGLRLDLRIRPLATHGPYLKPGDGPTILVSDKNGRQIRTRRDFCREEEQARALEIRCPSLSGRENHDWEWIFQDPEECLQLLDELRGLGPEILVEWPEGERFTVSPPVALDQLSLHVHKKNNWFELSGQLQLDDTLVLDMRKLLELMPQAASPGRFVPLGQGHYLALSDELRKGLDAIRSYAECRKKSVRIHPLAALAMNGLPDDGIRLSSDRAWRDHLARLKTLDNLNPTLPSSLRADLRDYQVEGFKWMTRLAHLGVGACLADDMGLGKTIQALAVLLDRAARGPALVVAPTSVCLNWREETNRFAPALNVKLFGGRQRRTIIRDLKPFDLLICSYGLLQQDADVLAEQEWQTIVLDEAQAIKNFLTKRSRAAMKLKGAFKLITTGTPIENHLAELWNLFQFINPGLLGPLDHFTRRFAGPIEKEGDAGAKKKLKKLIHPFILRRVKAEVLEELPSRTDITLRVAMNKEEAALYEALRQRALDRLHSPEAPGKNRHLRILAEIMRLRRACCNPKLVVPDTGITSSKLDLFGKVLEELLENRHKALVFSQFVDHLRILREFLEDKNISYQYLDGKTPAKARQKRVEAFQSGRGEVFLISLKAGGMGLNLTAADYVIHMDPWWNPAVEEQASDRAHRIGQTRPVTIYRLVSRGTIEEKIVQLHEQKKELADSLLEGSGTGKVIKPEELLELLR